MFPEKSKIIGVIFAIIHGIIVYLTMFIAIFSNDFFILYSIGIILLLIIFFNHFYGDCPITTIEEHHLGFSSVDIANGLLPIKYDKNRRSEVTLQWIFMSLVIVFIKILFLFLFKVLKDLNVKIKY